MVTFKGWLRGCAAGIVFGLGYNILFLHESAMGAIINIIVVALEANLLLLIFFKLCELLGL
jgi:hypothetical protein